MADWWDLLFTDLQSFLSSSCAREANATISEAEATLVKLEGYIYVLFTIITTLKEESREFHCFVGIMVSHFVAAKAIIHHILWQGVLHA